MLRAMLAVPYFEKALYELPESEVTAENIQALADRIENEIQGGMRIPFLHPRFDFMPIPVKVWLHALS